MRSGLFLNGRVFNSLLSKVKQARPQSVELIQYGALNQTIWIIWYESPENVMTHEIHGILDNSVLKLALCVGGLQIRMLSYG